jgi:hypothetical protein
MVYCCFCQGLHVIPIYRRMKNMADPQEMNTSRRSFFKWSLLGISTLAASTLSNVAPLISGKEQEQAISILADTSTVITNASQGSHHRLTTSQDFLLANPINARDGQRIIWEITQDGIGRHRMTLDDKFVFGANFKNAVLSRAANKTDFLTAIYNAPADKWHVVAFVRGY